MSTPDDDRDLDELLAGRSDLSRRYRAANAAASMEAPPAELDRAILAKARAAVETTSATVAPLPVRKRTAWRVPFAVAASVLLTFAIVRESGNETGIVGDLSTRMATEQSVAPASAPAAADTAVEGDLPAAAPGRESPPVAITAVTGPVQQDRAEAVAVTRDEVARNAVESRAAAPASVTPAPPLPEIAIASSGPAVTESASVTSESGAPAPPAGVATAARAPAALRPSVEAQRAEAEAAKSRRAPDEWLNDVRKLRAAGQGMAADEELKRFLEAYPDYFTQNPGIAMP